MMGQGRGHMGAAVRSFAANTACLQPRAFAYSLGNLLRRPAALEPIKDWSPTSLMEKPIKVGAKGVDHGQCVAVQMVEAAIARNAFADIPRLSARLRPARQYRRSPRLRRVRTLVENKGCRLGRGRTTKLSQIRVGTDAFAEICG